MKIENAFEKFIMIMVMIVGICIVPMSLAMGVKLWIEILGR